MASSLSEARLKWYGKGSSLEGTLGIRNTSSQSTGELPSFTANTSFGMLQIATIDLLKGGSVLNLSIAGASVTRRSPGGCSRRP